ncbi:hypothetical protein [Dyella caseinilytica]|uniref:Uncharacterized protein n=1 Tax=Dyella caseinilytica TaxID=1849581 RepID=A0ABX7GP83_9GAMM|nr:hypothetical protein [Dyella caseinilytica]QRN52050.1 hypothetical protein ISN74_11080 [Dyella caseinilytica]GGA15857.1 hypothetical protein GCM10011408_42270 [Dyella caseinilytica]
MNFSKQDNWEDVSRYDHVDVEWSKCHQGAFAYEAKASSSDWKLRMNNFPDEPLFTLFIDAKEVLHFNDWPKAWKRPK